MHNDYLEGTRMDLATYIRRHKLGTPELLEFLQEYGYDKLHVEQFDASYGGIKRAAKDYAAVRLHGEFRRLDLFKGLSALVGSLKEDGHTTRKYDLSTSFLGHDEVNLIILKLLHNSMTHEDLARRMGVTPTTIDTRIAELKDGMRIGDFEVSIAPDYGGKLESTVHPVLLPLNLAEVYMLVSTLETAARELDGQTSYHAKTNNPRAIILRDIAEKIYYQLTDYAKGAIAKCLADMGIKMYGEVRPSFVRESRPGSSDEPQYRSQRAGNWGSLEKAGQIVRVSCADGSTHVGTLRSWEPVAPLLAEDDPRNPAYCFVLVHPDGTTREALSWAEVVDIEAAD